jgi:predicted RNA-binding protein with RPS1 domain
MDVEMTTQQDMSLQMSQEEKEEYRRQEEKRLAAITEHERLVRQKQRYDALDDALQRQWITDRVWELKTDAEQETWVNKLKSK